MQIVVRQTSGLGNQLFQYAAGRYLAKKYAASLRIAHELPQNLALHGRSRPVLLQKFAISARIGQVNPFDRLVLSTQPHFALAGQIARAAGKIQVIRQEPDAFLLRHDFQVPDGSRIVYLLGYWQTHSIVREVEAELRAELSLVEPLGEASQRMAQRIAATKTSVSIHLRRGDYVTVFGAKAVLPAAYYDRAIEVMMERFPDSTFFIFSDDVPYAKEWAARNPRFVLVDHNDDATAHEDLRLMALCQHHVIANSTFSWWGAWLNPRSDKQVVAPANWLGFETSKTDIALPGWTLI